MSLLSLTRTVCSLSSSSPDTTNSDWRQADKTLVESVLLAEQTLCLENTEQKFESLLKKEYIKLT